MSINKTMCLLLTLCTKYGHQETNDKQRGYFTFEVHPSVDI